jgi:hypothetical protein
MFKKLRTWISDLGWDDRSSDARTRLIAYLLDRNADLAGRDDCAMELAKYDENDAEQALLQIGADSSQDEVILDTCGESLGQIWVRQGRVDIVAVTSLNQTAREVALAVIQAKRPELMQNKK